MKKTNLQHSSTEKNISLNNFFKTELRGTKTNDLISEQNYPIGSAELKIMNKWSELTDAAKIMHLEHTQCLMKRALRW